MPIADDTADVGESAEMRKRRSKCQMRLIEAAMFGRMASLQTCSMHPNTDGSNPK